MDTEYREATAFEIVCDTFKDECAIELYENESLPAVLDPWNPFNFNITYRDGAWYCTAEFTCREDNNQFVTISRGYTNETVFAMRELYGYTEGEPDWDNNSEN